LFLEIIEIYDKTTCLILTEVYLFIWCDYLFKYIYTSTWQSIRW